MHYSINQSINAHISDSDAIKCTSPMKDAPHAVIVEIGTAS